MRVTPFGAVGSKSRRGRGRWVCLWVGGDKVKRETETERESDRERERERSTWSAASSIAINDFVESDR